MITDTARGTFQRSLAEFTRWHPPKVGTRSLPFTPTGAIECNQITKNEGMPPCSPSRSAMTSPSSAPATPAPEAALTAARLGLGTVLLTMNADAGQRWPGAPGLVGAAHLQARPDIVGLSRSSLAHGLDHVPGTWHAALAGRDLLAPFGAGESWQCCLASLLQGGGESFTLQSGGALRDRADAQCQTASDFTPNQ
jgi:hypothetical protein